MNEKHDNKFIDFLLDNFGIIDTLRTTKDSKKILLQDALKKLPDFDKDEKKDIEEELVFNWRRESVNNQKIVLREILKKANNIKDKKNNYETHPLLINVLTPAVIVFSIALNLVLFAPDFSRKFVFVSDELMKSSVETIAYYFNEAKANNSENIKKTDYTTKDAQVNITQEMKANYIRKNRYRILENKISGNTMKVARDELMGRVAGASDINTDFIPPKTTKNIKAQKENKILNFLYNLAEKQKKISDDIDQKLIKWINK